MAPSQRGLGVTIKRGRNGRTAKLNTPGVYITIDHVGVISCEPRQFASEVPTSKTTGFVEAPRGSPWFKALRNQDCKQLMDLLQKKPCRVVQKGEEGLTVLHAAAVRGCLKLLDQVFDLFKDNRRFVDEKEEIELSLQKLLEAEHIFMENQERIGAAGITAAEYAWFSMGECEARKYFFKDWWEYNGSPLLSSQSEICNSIIGPEAVDEGSLSPKTLLLGVLTQYRLRLLPSKWYAKFEEHLGYNFVADCEELRFHHACEYLIRNEAREYVGAVIGGCWAKGPHVLRYLFQLRNAQGRTPLHATALSMYGSCGILVGLIPGQERGENTEFVNMRDSRGWTALHLLSSSDRIRSDGQLKELLEDGRADVNATVKYGNQNDSEATALHLAVIHNRSRAVTLLIGNPRTDVNAFFRRRIILDDNLEMGGLTDEWTALQLAAVLGLPEMVKILINCPRVKDAGKRPKIRNCWAGLQGDKNDGEVFAPNKISALHLAAASGDPETLRLFITHRDFDPLVTCRGCTSLHFAVASSQPTLFQDDASVCSCNFVMTIIDFGHKSIYFKAKARNAKIISYKGREACISILVQAGVDVWQKDDRGNFPEPGRWASSENHLSWQQKVASETLEAKKSLNEAGNAISVVAALVATASYVGPLQPPLGYANDFVQTSNLSIRIFMITNSASFYLAIASIMFAVVPSLPMPQEGIYEEWQRTRQTIGIAISLLLVSVLGVLVSFAAASNAVVSEEYSWRHGGLTFYPAVVGGLVCLIGIIWFFIRLLRLIFPKSVMIRHLYQSLFQTNERRKRK